MTVYCKNKNEASIHVGLKWNGKEITFKNNFDKPIVGFYNTIIRFILPQHNITRHGLDIWEMIY